MKEPNVAIIRPDSSLQHTEVLLSGKLIISNAGAIKKQLINALNSSQNIKIVFKENITRIDMPVLQLLVAVQKSASKLGITTSYDTDSSEYIKLVLRNAGLEETFANRKSHLNGIQ